MEVATRFLSDVNMDIDRGVEHVNLRIGQVDLDM
jgi:hypothetical protein